MRKLVTVLAAVILTVSVFAQPPDKMSYQAVIRNSSNQLVTSHTIGIKITILQGSATGTAVYAETQTPTSNANGLVSIEIGGGTIVSGTFSGIDWSAGPYFIKTETDPTGGTSYTITGTSQLLSVPYALHSKSSGNGFASVYSETDPRPVLNENGNIGIGISANWAKLDVNGQLNIGPGQNTWGSQILINAASLERGKEYRLTSISGHGKLYFSCSGKGDVMVMDSNLNVGIGTDNPVSKLDVMGVINVNNNKITNVADPVNNNDAANKAYVDALKNLIYNELLDAGLNGIVKDADGNTYKTIKIGNQVWMAENLKYLPSVVGPATGSQIIPYYYVYGYNGTVIADAKATSNYTTYGVLYNWPAAMASSASSSANPSGVQGVCPTGWHLPSNAEWTQLTDYIGGESVAGGKLKETGTSHWSSPNTGATNETGFTALPGGGRGIDGSFDYVGNFGFWWSATEGGVTDALYRYMYYNYADVKRDSYYKYKGASVRCVRD